MSYVAPAHVDENIAPAPSRDAALAPVIGYILPAPVGYAAPASVVENIALAPAVSCVAPAPVDEYMASAPALYAVSAQVVEYIALAPIVGAAAPNATQLKAAVGSREMTQVTPRGSMRRSTFNDEDLDEAVDLSGHSTWANGDLYEIIQDLVEAVSHLQAIAKGHEVRMTTIVSSLLQTSQDRSSGVWNPQ